MKDVITSDNLPDIQDVNKKIGDRNLKITEIFLVI